MRLMIRKLNDHLLSIPYFIGQGAAQAVAMAVKELHLKGRGVAVYDDDTYRALEEKPDVFRVVLFDHQQLFCDQQSLFYLRKQSLGEADFLIGIGGEAIQAITKLIAAEGHLPYIAVPSCAYGTSMATAMAQRQGAAGMMEMKGALPAAVIADTSLIARASEGVTLGAVRELIDRMGSLTVARARSIAAGYAWDQALMGTQTEAIDAALAQCNEALRNGRREAYEKLLLALILCGSADSRQDALAASYPARLCFLNECMMKEDEHHE